MTHKNPKNLRTGYTTGSCAAAAARACAGLLIGQETPHEVELLLPSGGTITIPIHHIVMEEKSAVATVIKDSGDDPDITNGMSVCAKVSLNNTGEIKIDGGQGIGRVTAPGLKTPIGSAAINPVPLLMIEQNVRAVLPPLMGADILIFAPQGEEIAKKTYNPRLGIVGGISIIGTTGIVHPMSEEAWRESLALELSVVRSRGYDSCAFAFGNYGESYAIEQLNFPKEQIVIVSNFLGYMIDQAVELGFKKILLIGHIGKMIKTAGGIFYTHSKIADARMEILCCFSAMAGAPSEIVRAIYNCALTSQAISILEENRLEEVYSMITNSACKKMSIRSYEKIQFGAVLFDDSNRLLDINPTGKAIIQSITAFL